MAQDDPQKSSFWFAFAGAWCGTAVLLSVLTLAAGSGEFRGVQALTIAIAVHLLSAVAGFAYARTQVRKPPMRLRSRIVIAAVVIAMGVFVLWPSSVKTIVVNPGTTALRDVRVIVTGRAYTMGDIPPGESRSVRVRPTGESDILLQYTDFNGASQSAKIDCYMEAGYSGSISINLTNGAAALKNCDIRSGSW